ncbi:Dolichyl-diphosphooligosaccharide--protein glycosyltransferase subunit Swp1 [Ochromonadaceae sp. CCMP2298]|nr:Dolichyl-diphosphooligosaccharide--protein glycosyltransferase subunit Swp1 [Ochromonadaceae sp. CCMP2298]
MFYAVNFLEGSGLGRYSCDCPGLQNLMSQATTGYEVYYGIAASRTCILYDIAGGVLALEVLGQLTVEDKALAMNKLTTLMAPEGTFKMKPDDSESSIANLHMALEMLSTITTGNDASDFAADVFEKAFQLIPSGDGDSVSDALLMVPLSKLTDKKLRLVGTRLVIVTEILLSMKHSDDISVLSKVQEAFKIIASYKASPVFMDLQTNSFEASKSSQHMLKLNVLDVFGKPTAVESAEMVSVKNVGKDSIFFQGDKLTDGVLDMTSAGLTSGRYIAQFSVLLSGRPKPTTHQSYFVVSDTASVGDVSFAVSELEDISMAEMTPVSQQNSLSDVSINALSGERIMIEYVVTSAKKPHQSFVRLSHTETGASAHYAAKKSTAGGSAMTYSVSISVGEDIEKFKHLSGDYVVAILVGDAAYAVPVEYILGSVELRFPTKQAAHLPLYAKSLLHTSDTTHEKLPEIEHLMRPPAQRASDFMATVFTALTWVPLVVFLLYMLSLQPNLSRLGSVANLAALGCFAAILLLYVGYWLALEGVNFYDTIWYLVALTPMMAVLGGYSLNTVTGMREKEAKQD